MADYEIREAAESLLGSFSPPQARSVSQSHSVNMITEELVAGHRHSGRMSSVRRFFCLLVTFDLLFTSLIWLICVMIRGDKLERIFDSEVVHYNIKSSLFDIVMVAACRFTVLLLFYALLHINNWSIIALSTGCTCAFLIGKVFIYDWVAAKEPVYHVFLILTSFTLSWGEAWFLDFRVLPQELHAKHIMSCLTAQAGSASGATERTPLCPGGSRGLRSAYAESTVNWFSPIETPETSPRPRRPGEEVILTQEQIEEYKRLADASVASGWQILRVPGWKLEKRGTYKGDVVESLNTKEFGKVFRFTGTVDCSARFLYEDMRDNLARMPEWNPTILHIEIIKVTIRLRRRHLLPGNGGRRQRSDHAARLRHAAARLRAARRRRAGAGGGRRGALRLHQLRRQRRVSGLPARRSIRARQQQGGLLVHAAYRRQDSGRRRAGVLQVPVALLLRSQRAHAAVRDRRGVRDRHARQCEAHPTVRGGERSTTNVADVSPSDPSVCWLDNVILLLFVTFSYVMNPSGAE